MLGKHWVIAIGGLLTAAAQPSAPTAFLGAWCGACHSPKARAGGFSLSTLERPDSFRDAQDLWNRAATRVRNFEMPPRGAPAPSADLRERFVSTVQQTLRQESCSTQTAPPPARIRRLNRGQYSATIRDLLNLHTDAGAQLPADGAGGEGFDNAEETLFLSPIHAEKYLDAAKAALNAAAKDPPARARFLTAQPSASTTPDQAARAILAAFLPRAFRRPVDESDIAFHLSLYEAERKRGGSFDDAILYALRGALISPRFLFRVEPNGPLDDYALASRLSYFLWNSMPDAPLFELAASGQLHDPAVLKAQVARMLRDARSFDFAQSFVEQWLRTRELAQTTHPDPGLFPPWKDAELQGDIRYQPVLFFREIIVNNLPLLDLIDSKWTIATRKLQKLYGLNVKPPKPDTAQQPQRIELPEASGRGGLLGMAAVLAVSSHPHRTSPVLRGKWLLDAMLGTPPPPPPPGVPPLDEGAAASARTLRDRLAAHRANAACASCHDRIDPLGFALENYDAIGRWRTEDAGQPIDASGQLPDGTRFNGPAELKSALMARKELFVRNLTRRLLGYALGRGLAIEDACAVETIAANAANAGYSAQSLITEIVMSPQFRIQGARP
ncbi:MAG: DUF1592 domain-containing protein [Acidobacteria bacterium]|nr:DUF1592 domain-containing protein [Acidobacteriota bacterium]